MTQQRLRDLWAAVSPAAYMNEFAANPKRVLLVHATYDLTFLQEYSLQVSRELPPAGNRLCLQVLPCGHYTTGGDPLQVHGWVVSGLVRLLRF